MRAVGGKYLNAFIASLLFIVVALAQSFTFYVLITAEIVSGSLIKKFTFFAIIVQFLLLLTQIYVIEAHEALGE
jgi:ammonia channel protein AmtB